MNIYATIPLVAVIAYIALISIIATRPLARVHKVFVLYLTVSMLWSFISFILHADFLPSQTLWWNRALVLVGGSAPVVYYHFVRTFFNKPAGKGTYIGYAALIGLAIYVSLGGLLKSSYVVDGILYHELDPVAFYPFTAFGASFVGIALLYLIQGFRKSTSPQNRNRIGYLLGAAVVWVVFMATNFNRDLANYSVDHLGNIANALIISYAILRFQLLNIKFVMRRGLAYFIVAVCLLGVYVGVILLGYWFLPDQPLVVMLLIASVVTLSLAFLARPLRYTIQEWVDRFFYRGTYQYRQTLLNFSRRMGNIINLDTLASEMLPTISKALRVPNARLLLKVAGSGDFTTQFTYPKAKDEMDNDLRLNPDHPIIAQIENEVSPLDLKQIDSIHQLKGLWETEKEQLLASDLELLCPIKSRGNLIGILALGKKRADTTYSHEDIELITSMANQAGIIIENAMMLDTLKKQQAQVERLLAQVVQVQEEERRRISVDLHDSVAQWLVAASYRAQSFSQALSKENGEEAQDELSSMEDTLNKSLKELRRVVIGLRPPALDELGLAHAMRQSLEELKTDGLDCKFIEIGTPIRPPSNVEIAVYRIVQEALSNIRRHSDASKVNLSLQFQKEGLLVEIRDNGKGFDLHQTLEGAVSVGHMGLLGMRQRAEMLGGDFRIKSKEGAGTTIILSLPIQPQIEEE